MATSSQLKSRVDDLTTCSICLELFHIPKSLPCLHTFCLKCLEGHCRDKLPGDQTQCPLCREEFSIPPNGLAGLKSNFFVTSLVDARKVSVERSAIIDKPVQCEVCAESREELSEIRKATVYCVNCREKLCEQCSRPHRRMRTGPHKVITIGSEEEVEVATTRGSNCVKHKNDEVRLYCFDCKENICLVCSAVEHDQHKRQEISKAAADFKKQIDADHTPLISLTSDIRGALVIMGKEFEKFIEDIDVECAYVKTTGDEIRKIVETRVAQLIDEINTVKSAARKAFVTQKEKLEFMLLGLESFSTYCSELTSKGKPSDITRAASDLHNRATELLQTDIVQFKNYVAPSFVFTPADVSTISDIVGYVLRNACSDINNIQMGSSKGDNEIQQLRKAFADEKLKKEQAMHKLAEILNRKDPSSKGQSARKVNYASEMRIKEKEYWKLEQELKQEKENFNEMASRLQRDLSELQAVLNEETQKVTSLRMELESKDCEIEHLRQKMSVAGADNSSVSSNNELDDDSAVETRLEGWLSVPNKQNIKRYGWKRQYVVVSSKKIFFYNSDNVKEGPQLILDIESVIKFHRVMYATEGGSGMPESKEEKESLGPVPAGIIQYKGHDFVPLHYRTPTNCEACNKTLWHMFHPPTALECRRCHMKFHQEHYDKKEVFVGYCKVNTEVQQAKEMLLMAGSCDDQKVWVQRLAKKVARKGIAASGPNHGGGDRSSAGTGNVPTRGTRQYSNFQH